MQAIQPEKQSVVRLYSVYAVGIVSASVDLKINRHHISCAVRRYRCRSNDIDR